jgi:hypothetical protein
MRQNGRKRKGKPLLLLAVGLLAASVLAAGMALAGEAGNELSQPAVSNTGPANGPAVSEQPPASGGLRVFIDPKTGEITEPSQEEKQALTPKQAPREGEMRQGPLAPEAAPIQELVGPGGEVGVVLDESFMVNSIVRKNKDGSLSFDCVTGDKNAAVVVTEEKKADKPARKEDRHEK